MDKKTPKKDISNPEEIAAEEIRGAGTYAALDSRWADIFRLLFANAAEGVFMLQNDNIVWGNESFFNIIGYNKKEAPSIELLSLLFPEERKKIADNFRCAYATQKFPAAVSFRILAKNGVVKWLELKSSIIYLDGRKTVLNFCADISEYHENERILRENEAKYRLLIKSVADVIWVYNFSLKRFTYISDSVLSLRGFTPDEIRGESLNESIESDFRVKFKSLLKKGTEEFLKSPHTPANYLFEALQRCKNGSSKWVEISIKFRFGKGGEIELAGVTRDIDERKKTEKQFLNLSYNDPLTGLYNRRYYEMELKRLNYPRNLPISLIMADVDGLKMTNDAFGHAVGDKLLIRVAEIIRDNSRADDIVARVGGDEFVILLPQTAYTETERMVKRIKDSIATEDFSPVKISVSLGFATKEAPGQKIDEVYKEAEDFMYRCKLSEGNNARSETIKVIINNLYQKSAEEKVHAENVGGFCRALAEAMEMSASDIEEMAVMGTMHDIGKIGINMDILKKAYTLTETEFQDVQRHAEISYQILKSSNEFSAIAYDILCHHERLDGYGYPRGIKGAEISRKTRILTIADAFDSMTSGRFYKNKISIKAAAAELKRNINTQFDPELVKAFIEKVLGMPY
jgi:diguanylate cyclase (GGDEF)-like protein/PAS domain S-box-containing protein